jgi:hypothetical protein
MCSARVHSTKVRLYQSPVCYKIISYQSPFFQSPVLPKSSSTKVRFYQSPYYQNSDLLECILPKSGLRKKGDSSVPNSFLPKSAPHPNMIGGHVIAGHNKYVPLSCLRPSFEGPMNWKTCGVTNVLCTSLVELLRFVNTWSDLIRLL